MKLTSALPAPHTQLLRSGKPSQPATQTLPLSGPAQDEIRFSGRSRSLEEQQLDFLLGELPPIHTELRIGLDVLKAFDKMRNSRLSEGEFVALQQISEHYSRDPLFSTIQNDLANVLNQLVQLKLLDCEKGSHFTYYRLTPAGKKLLEMVRNDSYPNRDTLAWKLTRLEYTAKDKENDAWENMMADIERTRSKGQEDKPVQSATEATSPTEEISPLQLKRITEIRLFLSSAPNGLTGLTVLEKLNGILTNATGFFSRIRRKQAVPESELLAKLGSETEAGKAEANRLMHGLVEAGYLLQRPDDPEPVWKLTPKAKKFLETGDPIRALNIGPNDMKAILSSELKDLEREKAEKMERIQSLGSRLEAEQKALQEKELTKTRAASVLEAARKTLGKLPAPPTESIQLLEWEEKKWQADQEVTRATTALGLVEKEIALKQGTQKHLKAGLDNAVALQRAWNRSANEKAARLHEALTKLDEALLTQDALDQIKDLQTSAAPGDASGQQNFNHQFAKLFMQIEQDYFKALALLDMSTNDSAAADADVENQAELALLRAEAKTAKKLTANG